MLINRTNGEKINIFGDIKISPDKQRLISYNIDLTTGDNSNGIQIIKLLKNHFVKEYEMSPSNWGPTNVKWISKSEIEIIKSTLSADSKQLYKAVGTTRFILKNNKWVQK